MVPNKQEVPFSEMRDSLSSLFYRLEREGDLLQRMQTAISVMSVDSSVEVVTSGLFSVIFTS